jgi:hypothetical protein
MISSIFAYITLPMQMHYVNRSPQDKLEEMGK